MALITYHKSLILILLLTIFVSVQSKSVESDVQQETEFKYPLRERRQVTTVPALLNALAVFVGQLLVFVANLLFLLGNALPIILGALGLGGLGLSLDIIVTQLGLLVLSLAGRRRRATTPVPPLDDVIQKLKNAKTALLNINNLNCIAQNLNVTAQLNNITTKLNVLLPLLSSTSSSGTDLKSKLSDILSNLNNVVNQIQSTTNTLTNSLQSNVLLIFQGLTSPLSYFVQTGTTLIPALTTNGFAALTLVFDNLAKAQNTTVVNFSILDNALYSISNSTVNLLLSTTNQLGNATSQALVTCVAAQG